MPIVLIAYHSVAILSRDYRRDLIETSAQPYFRTALAKGLARRQAIWRHGHRSAVYALLAAVRSETGWVIGSTATMESLFGLPGISQFLVQSIIARDQMVLQAYVMVSSAYLLFINMATFLILKLLDPRVT